MIGTMGKQWWGYVYIWLVAVAAIQNKESVIESSNAVKRRNG